MSSSSQATVTIRGYYEEPESMHDKNTLTLEGVSDGEFVEVVVIGTIREFQLVRLEWDEEKDDLLEREVIHEISEITDRTIVVKTFMPCGIPSEKIKWKSITNRGYEFIIHEDLGDDPQGFWEFVCK